MTSLRVTPITYCMLDQIQITVFLEVADEKDVAYRKKNVHFLKLIVELSAVVDMAI